LRCIEYPRYEVLRAQRHNFLLKNADLMKPNHDHDIDESIVVLDS